MTVIGVNGHAIVKLCRVNSYVRTYKKSYASQPSLVSRTDWGQVMSSHGGEVSLPPSSDKIRDKFDLAIALILASWSSLTLAVQNLWGGPESSEKRDWFAGAISDLIADTPDADIEYVEEFLLQVMNDEFDVNADDGSGADTAAQIIEMRKLTQQGSFETVDEMYKKWTERQGKNGSTVNFKQMTAKDEEGETDWDSDDTEDNADEDEDMVEAPALVKMPREKLEPKIDEDGFTEVVGRKRR